MKTEKEATESNWRSPAMTHCWLCHGWGMVDRRTRDETSWSYPTGGPNGQRFPVYELHPAFASCVGELIECPVCRGGAT
jgi:hypothetical protein